MASIFETDRLNAGVPQLILENEHLSVLLQPEIGGRILDVEANNFPFLHRTYPKSVPFGPYIEHGGMEECIGSPLTSRLWKTPWKVDKGTDNVTLSVISPARFNNILLAKTLSLEPDAPILKIEYSFTNFDPRFNKFTFSIHPELCLGNALKNNAYHLPAPPRPRGGPRGESFGPPVDGGGDDVLSGGFTAPGFKQFITPGEGWGAVTCNGMVFGMLFPPRVIDSIEIYYPRIGTHFVIQPLIYGVGLSPNRRASFTSMFYFGEGDVDTIRELYERKGEDLTMSYVPIEAMEEWPLDHDDRVQVRQGMADERGGEEARGRGGEGRNKFSPCPLTHTLPHTHAPTHPKTFREHQRFDQVQMTDIRLSNMNGAIEVQGWEEAAIELETIIQFHGEMADEVIGQIEDARPEVIQHGGLLLIRTGKPLPKIVVNQYLRVPQVGMRRLELNFVNGEVTLINAQPYRLKIGSMGGDITIKGAIAEDAEYDINTVSGDINIELADSAACSIDANCVTGRLTCDLDLADVNRRANWMSGVLHAPKANLRLNSISGNITLTQTDVEGG
ncbi:DUF4097 family beta strand repeat protein [Candidatus Poribacteria bacterium]|nr:DUF4097 family beta strand repeat protein [Candidatus Poribacteria bacterium]